MATPASSDDSARKFGTFGGVFTPCTLTILGVIMFLRFGEVVGNAGIVHALLIVTVAKLITGLTTFSLSAIATNTPVKGGGAYFMISRSLGVAPGGAIGLVLYLAQGVSVAMYVIGFTEAAMATFPQLPDNFRLVATVVNLFVAGCVYIGAGWTIKLQYGILALLAASLVSFAAGAVPLWSLDTFTANLAPAYTAAASPRTMFALFFPAVTGIMAGANMSGDLRDPSRSIPRGTLAAIGVTAVIYLGLAFALGGLGDSTTLRADTMLMRRVSAVPVLVTAGIFAANLSSALGSMMGAPRILQSLSRDQVFRTLRPFASESGVNREPRRAVLATALLAQAAILLGDLNTIAPIITMFFIITYGMLNLACFAEIHSRNPSFRPSFHVSHQAVPLIGALGCLAAMFLVNTLWALLSIVLMGLIYGYLQRADLETRWGDVNSGVAFERAKRALLYLDTEAYHPKNWRPSIMVFTGNPAHRLHLARLGVWLTDRGLLTLARVVGSESPERAGRLLDSENDLRGFIREHRLAAFPVVVSAANFPEGARNLIQCHGLGLLRSNTVLLGWSDEPARQVEFGQTLRMISRLKRSILLVRAREELFEKDGAPPGPIDVWWRGRNHGSLMLLMAHLLSQTPEWRNRKIRLLRAASSPEEVPKALRKLEGLIRDARIRAEPGVVHTDDFAEALRRESRESALVFLGFLPPEPGEEAAFMERFRTLTADLPTVILVNSEGSARLEA